MGEIGGRSRPALQADRCYRTARFSACNLVAAYSTTPRNLERTVDCSGTRPSHCGAQRPMSAVGPRWPYAFAILPRCSTSQRRRRNADPGQLEDYVDQCYPVQRSIRRSQDFHPACVLADRIGTAIGHHLPNRPAGLFAIGGPHPVSAYPYRDSQDAADIRRHRLDPAAPSAGRAANHPQPEGATLIRWAG